MSATAGTKNLPAGLSTLSHLVLRQAHDAHVVLIDLGDRYQAETLWSIETCHRHVTHGGPR